MIYAKNLPLWERTLRTLGGVAIIAYAWLASASPVVLAGAAAAGAMLIVTSLISFCPACAMVGRRAIGKEH